MVRESMRASVRPRHYHPRFRRFRNAKHAMNDYLLTLQLHTQGIWDGGSLEENLNEPIRLASPPAS